MRINLILKFVNTLLKIPLQYNGVFCTEDVYLQVHGSTFHLFDLVHKELGKYIFLDVKINVFSYVRCNLRIEVLTIL